MTAIAIIAGWCLAFVAGALLTLVAFSHQFDKINRAMESGK